MKKLLNTAAAFLALTAISTTASAAIITDTYSDPGGLVYLSLAPGAIHQDYSFTHDITDGINGFRPGVDTINSATLTLDAFDDNSTLNGTPEDTIGGPETFKEFFRLELDSNFIQVFEVDFSAIAVSVTTSLLDDGLLNVYLKVVRPQGETGVSDFIFRSSTLSADVTRGDGAIPAPFTALLFASLLPLALLRRFSLHNKKLN